jgi:hypothetical protein
MSTYQGNDQDECPICLEPIDESSRSPSECGHSTCKDCRLLLQANMDTHCPLCKAVCGLPDLAPITCIGRVKHVSTMNVGTIEIISPAIPSFKGCRASLDAEAGVGLHRLLCFNLVRTYNGYRYTSRVEDIRPVGEVDMRSFSELYQDEYDAVGHVEIKPPISDCHFAGVMSTRIAHRGFGLIKVIHGPFRGRDVFIHVSNCWSGTLPATGAVVAFNSPAMIEFMSEHSEGATFDFDRAGRASSAMEITSSDYKAITGRVLSVPLRCSLDRWHFDYVGAHIGSLHAESFERCTNSILDVTLANKLSELVPDHLKHLFHAEWANKACKSVVREVLKRAPKSDLIKMLSGAGQYDRGLDFSEEVLRAATLAAHGY